PLSARVCGSPAATPCVPAAIPVPMCPVTCPAARPWATSRRRRSDMNFKKQIFGFMDMLRFTKLVPNRRKALESGADTPLPQHYRVNEMATALHPGRMEVEVTAVRALTDRMTELTFRRTDGDAFPFFRAGQYVSLQGTVEGSVVSRPYSISSSPREALENKLTLGIE